MASRESAVEKDKFKEWYNNSWAYDYCMKVRSSKARAMECERACRKKLS